ncbi:hypothetical protein L0Y40_02855 [Candidatus Wolfebacteria bacterium]|nr:hypothetical protein [Candidatus Wolfebacteria bacterium]
MTTLEKKRLERLEREVAELRAMVRAVVPFDDEGEYRPEFIRELKKALRKKPTYTYTGSGALLEQLKSIK